jgi:hypothetical protein
MNTTALRVALAASLAFSAVACGMETTDDGADSFDDTSAALNDTGGTTTGGACTVVDGVNKGKKGTFNADGDCEGDWGLTECTNQDGTTNHKCQAGLIIVRPPIVWGGTSGGLVRK